MIKLLKPLNALLLLSLVSVGVTSCANEKTIRICASEIPHAKILNECIKPLLKEEGYSLQVRVLDWTEQNSAVASGDYDANYFQHMSYLETYNASVEDNLKLTGVVKVHYERLCMYASSLDDKVLDNGEKIVIVDDLSNIERALKLLEQENIITINDNAYVNGEFTFDTTKPLDYVTFEEEYQDCTLKCLPENTLCAALPDYDFGILSGNTAMLGLSSYQERIVFGENSEEEEDAKANVIACRTNDVDNEKIQTLVKVFANEAVSTYIQDTFGESVKYHYVNLLA